LNLISYRLPFFPAKLISRNLPAGRGGKNEKNRLRIISSYRLPALPVKLITCKLPAGRGGKMERIDLEYFYLPSPSFPAKLMTVNPRH
jgi:hypothetical protein